MTRMHSPRKGVSGSTRPSEKKDPEWIRYKQSEVELLVSKLAKEGKSTSEIGLILRDSYGVPDVKNLLKKSITKILEEKKVQPDVPEDLMNLIKKSVKIKTHLEENGQDKVSKRGLSLTEAKINRLVKYYKRNGRLSKDWKYDPEKIKLMIQ